MSKYDFRTTKSNDINTIKIGYYTWAGSRDMRAYHFGNGYIILRWREGIYGYFKNGENVEKEELRKIINVMNTPLYKAVYGG